MKRKCVNPRVEGNSAVPNRPAESDDARNADGAERWLRRRLQVDAGRLKRPLDGSRRRHGEMSAPGDGSGCSESRPDTMTASRCVGLHHMHHGSPHGTCETMCPRPLLPVPEAAKAALMVDLTSCSALVRADEVLLSGRLQHVDRESFRLQCLCERDLFRIRTGERRLEPGCDTLSEMPERLGPDALQERSEEPPAKSPTPSRSSG